MRGRGRREGSEVDRRGPRGRPAASRRRGRSPPKWPGGSRSKGRRTRRLLTAAEPVRLERAYRVADGAGSFPADEALGVDGLTSLGTRRCSVLAGFHDSFARAQRLMNEMLGWAPDDEVIRRRTHAAALKAATGRPPRRDAGRFAAASGAVELEVDAGKVSTTGGWRDAKVAVFARREPGEPTPVADWADRSLPAPPSRSAVAAVEEAGDFAERVRREADRLGTTTADAATVLDDGAKWIWNLAAAVLP